MADVNSETLIPRNESFVHFVSLCINRNSNMWHNQQPLTKTARACAFMPPVFLPSFIVALSRSARAQTVVDFSTGQILQRLTAIWRQRWGIRYLSLPFQRLLYEVEKKKKNGKISNYSVCVCVLFSRNARWEIQSYYLNVLLTLWWILWLVHARLNKSCTAFSLLRKAIFFIQEL